MKKQKRLRVGGFSRFSEVKEAIAQLPIFLTKCHERTYEYNSVKSDFESSARVIAQSVTRLNNHINQLLGGEVSGQAREQVGERIRELHDFLRQAEKLRAAYSAKEDSFKNFVGDTDIKALAQKARDATEPEKNRSELERSMKFSAQRMQLLEQQKSLLESEKRSALEKSETLFAAEERLELLKRQIDDHSLRHSAFELAISVLNESDEYMKSAISPRIGRTAGKLFEKATAGAYNTLSVDTALAMSFSGGSIVKSCDYLSAGTRDCAHLCLRLALVRLFCPELCPPVLFDDAFGRMDKSRLRAFFRALSEQEGFQQFFIFSCESKERAALEEEGIPFTTLRQQIISTV